MTDAAFTETDFRARLDEVIHAQGYTDYQWIDPKKDRHAWSRKVNVKLLDLERAVFLTGCERAFILFMDSCTICKECTGSREQCREPRLSRPGPEAMAMDVYSTVRQFGFPIQVVTGYEKEMNRYTFLMVR